MSAEGRRAVVVGGGIIGLASAHYLVRDGWSVTIVEKGRIGRGTSAGNCGLVCPSHILPLAEPGAVGKTLRALFRKDSPFSIRPRIDPSLWSWLLRFALRCNDRDMKEAGHGIQPLLESSLDLYGHLIEREGLECEWERRGLLFAYRSKEALDAYDATDRLLAESFHCPAHKLDEAALLGLEPALKPGLAGGWYYDDDAHLRPDKLIGSWRKSLESAGVTIREGCAFASFRPEGGRAGAVVTDSGEIPAEAFVVATGALTPMLHGPLGVRVPIQPGKGYSLTMPRPAICPRIPMIFPETRVAVTPFQSGYRLGSTMEFAGYDDSIRPERLRLLKIGAEPFLREPYCDPVEDEWFGWRPMTYDSLPIIDRSPSLSNVLIVAGHSMLGLSMAPASGKLAAEMIGGRATHLDPSPYRLSRF